MYTDATHFAHRESSGYVIDLYWDPADAWHQFRVQVLERGSGNGFVLFPTTGRAAVEALHHPFATAFKEPANHVLFA